MTESRLRAAAYCRVSTGNDLQDGSYETQCAFYRKKILENPNLVLAGIYGDHGKSGRTMRTAP